MITEVAIRRAIEHLNVVGDTDLFPRLPEAAIFAACEDEVVAELGRQNLGSYNPVGSVEMLVPKSELGFRIGHQLTATDTLVYTAAVIENAESIEQHRRETSADAAFSYRYDPDGGARLFKINRGYHDWMVHLSTFGQEDPLIDARPVLATDIADYYQRIYFHRIEAILEDVGASRSSAGAIKKIIQVCRSKQSFGLPVGSSASRLLAEGLLCDTDKMLRDMGLEVTRFVDDYRIVGSEQHNTHTILCRLAEYLMVTEGLSLNVGKTKVTDTKKLQSETSSRLDDVFTSAEMRGIVQRMNAAYSDEEIEDEDDNGVPDNPFLDGDDLLERLDELKRRGAADFSSRKAVLRVLRRVGDFDALRLLRTHRELAYHLPRDFSRAIQATVKVASEDRTEIEAAVWDLLRSPPISELSIARLWLLNLYSFGTLPVDRKLLDMENRQTSVLEERQFIFIRARLNDRAYFRDKKTRLGQFGEWQKQALLIGASCLPKDEYKHWIDIAVRQMTDPFAKIFGTWLKSGQDLNKLLAV